MGFEATQGVLGLVDEEEGMAGLVDAADGLVRVVCPRAQSESRERTRTIALTPINLLEWREHRSCSRDAISLVTHSAIVLARAQSMFRISTPIDPNPNLSTTSARRLNDLQARAGRELDAHMLGLASAH
jgi:hypothetical protein